jgi:hypothetical protein
MEPVKGGARGVLMEQGFDMSHGLELNRIYTVVECVNPFFLGTCISLVGQNPATYFSAKAFKEYDMSDVEAILKSL